MRATLRPRDRACGPRVRPPRARRGGAKGWGPSSVRRVGYSNAVWPRCFPSLGLAVPTPRWGAGGSAMHKPAIARLREDIAEAVGTVDHRRALYGECSWGTRMPWLPIRQDGRLLEHLRPNAAGPSSDEEERLSDRSAQCRYASLSTLASTNSSLRELMLGGAPRAAIKSASPSRKPYSLLEVSMRAMRRELMRAAFERWISATASQAESAPRYFRCGSAARRYGVRA